MYNFPVAIVCSGGGGDGHYDGSNCQWWFISLELEEILELQKGKS